MKKSELTRINDRNPGQRLPSWGMASAAAHKQAERRVWSTRQKPGETSITSRRGGGGGDRRAGGCEHLENHFAMGDNDEGTRVVLLLLFFFFSLSFSLSFSPRGPGEMSPFPAQVPGSRLPSIGRPSRGWAVSLKQHGAGGFLWRIGSLEWKAVACGRTQSGRTQGQVQGTGGRDCSAVQGPDSEGLGSRWPVSSRRWATLNPPSPRPLVTWTLPTVFPCFIFMARPPAWRPHAWMLVHWIQAFFSWTDET